MANTVTVKIPNMTIGNPDIYIEAKEDNVIGTLTISKSFIEWRSRKKKYGYRTMNWAEFDAVITEYFNKKKNSF